MFSKLFIPTHSLNNGRALILPIQSVIVVLHNELFPGKLQFNS